LPSASRYPHLGKTASLLVVALAYLAAVIVGLEAAGLWPQAHPVLFVLVADIVATLVVFAFSAWYRNASVYDPYWSVIPILIVCYWAFAVPAEGVVPLRQGLVLLLVATWGLRLTWNWTLRWGGLGDEDWRYGMLRERHGSGYWAVNLLGIHMLPTGLVFAGCLAAWPAVAASQRDFGWLDGLALLLTAGAIWVEWRADRELRAHRAAGGRGQLQDGLWARCRHPNYLGEVGFWWGLYLFALAADPAWWWTGLGALSIHLLFILVSIPMMDSHLLAKNPGYADTLRALPALSPWPRRNMQRNP
jgi:steroid 5-alpha reductase family enzyme